MIQVFNKKLDREHSKIVTIRVSDPELKLFLKWIIEKKGTMSEFTRRLWKMTAEWEEFLQVKEEFQLEEKR